MRKCSIHLCGCTSTSHPDLCFYRLPIQEYRSEQWLKLITLDRPYSSQRSILVCGLHFPGGGKTAKYDQPTILPCSEEWPTVIAHYRNKRASLLTSAASWGQPETHDPTPCSSQSVDGLPSQLQGTETWQGECVDKESGSPLPTPFKRRSEKEMRCCCIVPGCIGNYPSGPEVAVFSFPRGKDMRALWVQAITHYDFTPDQYSKIQKVETASNSPSNASSSSTKTSDTALNAATSSVEEDDEDSDYEDPAVLLAEGIPQFYRISEGTEHIKPI
ncbi:hypothetical protein GWK47_022291 [Chionoecetes opilio]|uniref:THAP-type domain-containing protein n=1 Tax=Chionoecetes opilio TaxID=41210 RepID=A0A8J4XSD4_CHIOP|nr:hypothetical protein GWK47_022291 [Chionoecetes opilio]